MKTFKQLIEKNDDLNKKIFEYFVDNPYKSDIDYHKFAEKIGKDPDDIEKIAYQIISTFSAGGFAKEKGITKDSVDPNELKMGIKVEMEHLDPNSPFAEMMAERISLDHLAEISDYYTKLKKMENE